VFIVDTNICFGFRLASSSLFTIKIKECIELIMARIFIYLFLVYITKIAERCTFQVALYRIALFMHPSFIYDMFINNTSMPQNIRSNDSIIE